MAKKERWITTNEAAEQLGMLPHTLATYRCLNAKNGTNVGPLYRRKHRRVMYSQRAVDAFQKVREEDDKEHSGGQPG